MNAISSSRVYCFYPGLTAHSKSISGTFPPTEQEIRQLNSRSIEYNDSTAMWARECGQCCPMLWRLTYGLEGVGVYSWGGLEGKKNVTTDRFKEAHLRWRAGDDCLNIHCPYQRRV